MNKKLSKIPGPDSGIEIKQTICDICAPGPHCGLNAYIKDGRVIKVEGSKDLPSGGGRLCTRGAANKEYIYRRDRLKTPLKRTGERGSTDFESISWDEAFDIIEKKLKLAKDEYGPESVVWFSGYEKWYRAGLKRLCHSFGGHNYMTESSSCYRAGRMANELMFGIEARPDLKGKPPLIVAWASNPMISSFPMAKGLIEAKNSGSKIIMVDIRRTESEEQLSDLFLQPKAGTDGALALSIAHVIIKNNWQDQEFIDRYVSGFEEYKKLVSAYDPKTAERITNVPADKICKAAEWIGRIRPACIFTGNNTAHKVNGFNNHRAIMSLNIICGNFDKPKALMPVYDSFCEMSAGIDSFEYEFMNETCRKKELPQVGEERFPLWNLKTGDGQAMDLTRHILEEKPYRISSLCAFGMNTMMFPETPLFRKALEKLDFILAVDLFWTDACSMADIVLPACSSFERSEFKCYPGGYLYYTSPVIEPLYESRNDAEIITELAKRLCPEDTLLSSGYDACVDHIFRHMTDEITACRELNRPLKSAHFKPTIPGDYLRSGIKTPSAKLELYSSIISAIDPSCGLDPLPSYYDGTVEDHPFTLITGARLSHTLHSRLHKVPCLRSLRPDPMVDINPEDAEENDIIQNDKVVLSTDAGRVCAAANLTYLVQKGELHLYHGYEEADASSLLNFNMLDPYSGYPAYKLLKCTLDKA